MITYVNPAVAVALGALVLSERITLAMIGAFVLILGRFRARHRGAGRRRLRRRRRSQADKGGEAAGEVMAAQPAGPGG